MVKKTSVRTPDRILNSTLELFNRFGEPNVSTTLISAELKISPGNLYYHYPAKDELINALYLRFEQKMNALLLAADEVAHVEDAWFVIHSIFECMWDYRFLYRDLNDLLSKNRLLETRFQTMLRMKSRALRNMLDHMHRHGALVADPREIEPTAHCIVVVLTYWLSFEYARNPRQALEPEHAQQALMRGVAHTLHLLLPYLAPLQRQHLLQLIAHYTGS